MKASWVVNIRPKNWGDKDKIWFGKIKSEREAQLTSDIAHHYLGLEPVHSLFPEQDRIPPQFFNRNLEGLQTLERRLQYVKVIAKGDEYQSRRRELMDAVKEMVIFLTAGNEAADPEPWPLQPVPEYAIHGEYRLSPDIPILQQGKGNIHSFISHHQALECSKLRLKPVTLT